MASRGGRQAACADEPPLHERIDALVEAATAWPGGGRRPRTPTFCAARISISNGTIPDAATARAFLDDPSPTKRTALVDRLLADRNLPGTWPSVFDVMLMERRPQKSCRGRVERLGGRVAGVSAQELRRQQAARSAWPARSWRPTASIRALRPAAKFYLDRDGDPNLLARDVGRLFFGRDLQCAQCHDHPLVDDYLQSDYYGLMAFVSRGVLFTTPRKRRSTTPRRPTAR